MRCELPLLPPQADLETRRILKQVSISNRALAELKGFSDTIPNKNVLVNAITLNEAKDSSEIENIITTHDELFEELSRNKSVNPEAKEVVNYKNALWLGYERIRQSGFLTTNTIIEIQSIVEENKAGIRRIPGTVVKNQLTGEIVYTPPTTETEIRDLLANLEKYINEDFDLTDPLIKLAVMHYQFECIHPFYDGNGRTGRIMNVLYLVLKELLDSPILYLSRFIIQNKAAYYKLLSDVQNKGNWEEWILFILEGVEQTSTETLQVVKSIQTALHCAAEDMRRAAPKFYSKELVELLFSDFYTKIPTVEKALGVTRKTSSSYLSTLENHGFLECVQKGREKVFLNKRLIAIAKDIGQRRR